MNAIAAVVAKKGDIAEQNNKLNAGNYAGVVDLQIIFVFTLGYLLRLLYNYRCKFYFLMLL